MRLVWGRATSLTLNTQSTPPHPGPPTYYIRTIHHIAVTTVLRSWRWANDCPKHVELIDRSIKLLLLHLVGRLYCSPTVLFQFLLWPTFHHNEWTEEEECSVSIKKYPLSSRSIWIRNTCCTFSQIRNSTINSEHHCLKQKIYQEMSRTMWPVCRSKERAWNGHHFNIQQPKTSLSTVSRSYRKQCHYQWCTADSKSTPSMCVDKVK
jgi:hypothetical protein